MKIIYLHISIICINVFRCVSNSQKRCLNNNEHTIESKSHIISISNMHIDLFVLKTLQLRPVLNWRRHGGQADGGVRARGECVHDRQRVRRRGPWRLPEHQRRHARARTRVRKLTYLYSTCSSFQAWSQATFISPLSTSIKLLWQQFKNHSPCFPFSGALVWCCSV